MICLDVKISENHIGYAFTVCSEVKAVTYPQLFDLEVAVSALLMMCCNEEYGTLWCNMALFMRE